MRAAVRGLGEGVDLYLRLAGASIREQMQYRVSFLLRSFSSFALLFVDFLPILFLFMYFDGLQDWTVVEVGLLYGMVGTS